MESVRWAITPDGRQAVSGSSDQTLKVWDLESGRDLRTLSGNSDAVKAVAITRDERHVVSASEDQTLKVWDLESGAEIVAFKQMPASTAAPSRSMER